MISTPACFIKYKAHMCRSTCNTETAFVLNKTEKMRTTVDVLDIDSDGSPGARDKEKEIFNTGPVSRGVDSVAIHLGAVAHDDADNERKHGQTQVLQSRNKTIGSAQFVLFDNVIDRWPNGRSIHCDTGATNGWYIPSTRSTPHKLSDRKPSRRAVFAYIFNT
jgi:hypothetical protein